MQQRVRSEFKVVAKTLVLSGSSAGSTLSHFGRLVRQMRNGAFPLSRCGCFFMFLRVAAERFALAMALPGKDASREQSGKSCKVSAQGHCSPSL
jgi:hypothetical protein